MMLYNTICWQEKHTRYKKISSIDGQSYVLLLHNIINYAKSTTTTTKEVSGITIMSSRVFLYAWTFGGYGHVKGLDPSSPPPPIPQPTPMVLGARCSSVVRTFAHGAMGRRTILHGVDPLSYFSFQPVLHDWCNKGRGMYYPVCGMMHIKEPIKSKLL